MMSEPEPNEQPTPTLQPIPPSAAVPQGPAAPPPTMPPRPVPRAGPPPRRGSTWKVILLVLLLLALVGSAAINLVLLAGVGEGLEYPVVSMQTSVVEGGNSDEVVALYHVNGILDARAVAEFREFHRAVAHDGNVKAVVLRVDSPGGGVTASDQICELVKDLKARRKKVVVSMGSVAASGGYYISAPADEIYAEGTTVTGSIGVIAWWLALKGTLDKIGAEPVVIKSGHAEAWKDAWGGFSPPHDYQRKHIQDVLDKMQDRFEKVVQAGRGTRLVTRGNTISIPSRTEGEPPVKFAETEPFNGRIYLAEEAQELGLIDKIGYQEAALRGAARLAGLGNEKVVRYSRKRGLLDMLLQTEASPAVKLDIDLLDKLQTPRFMLLWKVD